MFSLARLRSEEGGLATETAIVSVGWIMVTVILIAAVRLHHSRLSAAGAAQAAARAAVSSDPVLGGSGGGAIAAGLSSIGCARLETDIASDEGGAEVVVRCIRPEEQARGILGGEAEVSARWERGAWPISPPLW